MDDFTRSMNLFSDEPDISEFGLNLSTLKCEETKLGREQSFEDEIK